MSLSKGAKSKGQLFKNIRAICYTLIMYLGFLVKGIILGFSIAATIGPISILCIRRTIAEGRAVGLISGLGIASADAVYGFIAAFGLTAVSAVLIHEHRWIQLIGGLFLFYLGIKTIFAKSTASTVGTVEKSSLAKSYSSIFFLTLTNPMTILSFVGVFAGLGIANGNIVQSAQTVIGVFLGSALWWLILSSAVNIVRSKLNTTAFRLINVSAGIIIITFSVVALTKS